MRMWKMTCVFWLYRPWFCVQVPGLCCYREVSWMPLTGSTLLRCCSTISRTPAAHGLVSCVVVALSTPVNISVIWTPVDIHTHITHSVTEHYVLLLWKIQHMTECALFVFDNKHYIYSHFLLLNSGELYSITIDSLIKIQAHYNKEMFSFIIESFHNCA